MSFDLDAQFAALEIVDEGQKKVVRDELALLQSMSEEAVRGEVEYRQAVKESGAGALPARPPGMDKFHIHSLTIDIERRVAMKIQQRQLAEQAAAAALAASRKATEKLEEENRKKKEADEALQVRAARVLPPLRALQFKPSTSSRSLMVSSTVSSATASRASTSSSASRQAEQQQVEALRNTLNIKANGTADDERLAIAMQNEEQRPRRTPTFKSIDEVNRNALNKRRTTPAKVITVEDEDADEARRGRKKKKDKSRARERSDGLLEDDYRGHDEDDPHGEDVSGDNGLIRESKWKPTKQNMIDLTAPSSKRREKKDEGRDTTSSSKDEVPL